MDELNNGTTTVCGTSDMSVFRQALEEDLGNQREAAKQRVLTVLLENLTSMMEEHRRLIVDTGNYGVADVRWVGVPTSRMFDGLGVPVNLDTLCDVIAEMRSGLAARRVQLGH